MYHLFASPSAGAGDDQRGTGLVNKNRVNLIDDGEVVVPLDELIDLPRHVVAQVVKTKLVVRSVGDVGGVLFAPLRGSHAGGNTAGRHPEEA